VSHAQVLHVHDDADEVVADFAVFCARPSCPKQVLQPAGRGRRRNYCSDACRQKANTEYRQAKARLASLLDQAKRERHNVQAYGRMDDEEPGSTPVDVTDEAALMLAASALANADRILQLVGDRDPIVVGALRSLVNDTTPLIRRLQAG
jgi:hypothetical protein